MVKTLIRVTRGGCGVNYTDANGVKRYALKTPESGAFECEIEQAKHFVALGMAEYVAENESAGKSEKYGHLVAHLDADHLGTMDYNDLKKLAEDMGVQPKGKKKADYIDAIVAAEIVPGDDDSDDEPPAPEVVDPE